MVPVVKHSAYFKRQTSFENGWKQKKKDGNEGKVKENEKQAR
jgi:hypothetical protein